MRQFLLAIQFLTILPIKIHRVNQRDLALSMGFYPLVGAILGLVLYFLSRWVNSLLPESVHALIIVSVWAILSGGLHLDGLADTLDGFVGGRDAETRISIMRDATIGAMGSLGLFFALGLKWATLSNLIAQKQDLFVLIFIVALSRYLMVYASFVSKYPSARGVGADYVGKISKAIFLFASCFMLFLTGVTIQFLGFLLLISAVLWASLWVYYCRLKIGGMTGDTLGALGELTEVGLLTLLCLRT